VKHTLLEMLAEGTYQLFHHGQACGEERWRIGEGPDELVAEGEQRWDAPFPYPNSQRYRVVLSPDWRVLALDLDWLVGERALHAEHRADGENWRASIRYEDQTKTQEGNYPYSAEVDFGSHLFNTFTLLRRGLGPGTDEEFPVLKIGPPFMAVVPERQRYLFVESGPIETPAGRFEAWRWQLTNPERPGDEGYTFWSDARGMVLESYEGPAPGRVWMRLTEYRVRAGDGAPA
jgi:hypothetical protein